MLGSRKGWIFAAVVGAAAIAACSNVTPTAGTDRPSVVEQSAAPTAVEAAPATRPASGPAIDDRILLTPANYETILTGTVCQAMTDVARQDFEGAVVGGFPRAGYAAVDLRPAKLFQVVFAVAADRSPAPGALPSKTALITDRIWEYCAADVKASLDPIRTAAAIADIKMVSTQTLELAARLKPDASPEFARFLAALATKDEAARNKAVLDVLRDERSAAAILKMTGALETYASDAYRSTMTQLVRRASFFTLKFAKAISEDAAAFKSRNPEAVRDNARDLTLYRALAYDISPEARLYFDAGLAALVAGARSGKAPSALGAELAMVDAIKDRINRQFVFVAVRAEKSRQTSSLDDDLGPLPPEGLGLLDGDVVIDLSAFGTGTLLASAD